MDKIKEIYVVFKTHFDIGFTGLASDIVGSYQGSMLAEVLETCAATSANEEGHRYVWTMSSWPFKKALETPDREMHGQALKLAQEGRLTWHALPFTTHTDFSGAEEFIRGMEIGAELDRTFHKKSIAAKMTDVPGHTRMLPSLLAKAGVRFLHLGCNACVNPPEVPAFFYWKGPDGGGVVTCYSRGGYGTSLLPPEDWDYPVWLALMNTGDNMGPHSAQAIRGIIDEVSEKLPGARVVIGTLDDFAEAFLACKPVLPVVEADLADSWIHGVGTYPNEVSRVRLLRKTMLNAEGALSLKALSQGLPVAESVKKSIYSAYENILLFDEHTWGLDTKISLLTLHKGRRVYEKKLFLEDRKTDEYKRIEASWAEKASYVRKAEKEVEEIVKAFSEGVGDTVAVYNLLPWERGGEADVTGIAAIGEMLVDSSGKGCPVYEREGRQVARLESLPPMGCGVYSVKKTEQRRAESLSAVKTGAGGAILENSRLRIEIDGKTGWITSFYDKANRKEWAAGGGNFGGYVYDIHGKEKIIQYLKDYAYDFEDWYIADNGRPGYPRIADRTYPVECCSVETVNACGTGMAVVTWTMPAESVIEYGNAPSVVMTVSLDADSDYADITYDVKGKGETPFVESGHFVFPLNAAAPRYAIQKMGAVIDPAVDIQYGANTSLYCCDRWMSVTDGPHGIAFFPKDTPLLSIGENRIYKYSKDYIPQKPVLYWNAFNNQWGTNFPQWMGGDYRFCFRIYPFHGEWSDTDMPRMAEEYATPLYLLKGGSECRLLGQSIENANILCLKCANDGRGFILRLQENRGKAGVVRVRLAEGLGVHARCSLLEEDAEVYAAAPAELAVETAPFEIHTLRIVKQEV